MSSVQFHKSRHTVSTMILFTVMYVITLLVVHILFGRRLLDWLKRAIWVSFTQPLMLHAQSCAHRAVRTGMLWPRPIVPCGSVFAAS